MRIGRVLSSSVTEILDSEYTRLQVEVEIEDPEDVQTAELFLPPGLESRPREDDAALLSEISDAWPVAIGIDSGIEPELDEGETEIFSYPDGTKLAKVRCAADGDVVINDGEDWAVQFTALKAAFEDLQTKWNTFAAAYVPGGPAGIGTPPTAQTSTADIADAKVETVRLP